jgi:hypothetical protein
MFGSSTLGVTMETPALVCRAQGVGELSAIRDSGADQCPVDGGPDRGLGHREAEGCLLVEPPRSVEHPQRPQLARGKAGQ